MRNVLDNWLFGCVCQPTINEYDDDVRDNGCEASWKIAYVHFHVCACVEINVKRAYVGPVVVACIELLWINVLSSNAIIGIGLNKVVFDFIGLSFKHLKRKPC